MRRYHSAALEFYRQRLRDSVVVRPSSGGGGSVLCCVSPVAQGTVALAIPLCDCITVADVRGGSALGGEAFQAAMRSESVAAALDDETATLLFVLSVAANHSSTSASTGTALSSLAMQCVSAVASAADCSHGQQPASDVQAELQAELASIHSALFPALTNACPAGFPADGFTLPKLVAAATWVDVRTVPVHHSPTSLSLIVAPFNGGAIQLHAMAPSVRAEVSSDELRLVATVDLPAGSELSLGASPWPGRETDGH